MADSKDFKINISTSATGDGAEKAAAGIEKAAAATEKLADASKKVEQPKFFDQGKIDQMESAAEAAAKVGAAAEHTGEKSHVSAKKVISLIGALSELSAAAAGEGGAEHGLEKLGHMVAAGAFATGNAAIGVLIASVMSLWKAFGSGGDDTKKAEADLEKFHAIVFKTSEVLREAAKARREWTESLSDGTVALKKEREEIEGIHSAWKRTLDFQSKFNKAETAAQIEGVRDWESEAPGRHGQAAAEIRAIKERDRRAALDNEQAKIDEEIAGISSQQGLTKAGMGRHQEELDKVYARKRAQEEIMRAATTRALLEKDAEEKKKALDDALNGPLTIDRQQKVDEASAAFYRARGQAQEFGEKADENAAALRKKYPQLGAEDADPQKVLGKEKQIQADWKKDQEAIAAADKKIAELKTERARQEQLFIKNNEAIMSRERREVEQAEKRDADEASAAAKKAQETRRKPIAETQRDEKQAEAGVKRAASDIERLIGLLEHNPDFQRSSVAQANKRELDEAAQKLKVDPSNSAALKQITQTIHKFAPAQDSAAAANIAALEKAVAAIEAWKKKVEDLTARLESLEAEATSE